MNRDSKPWARALWVGVIGLAMSVALLLIYPLPNAKGAPKRSLNPPPSLSVDESPLARDVRAGTSFAPIVKKVEPSVVNIYSTTVVHDHALTNPFADDPILRHFFGDGFGQSGRDRVHKEQGLGSGVIVSPEGYILTANHVVEGADTVKVALSSGEKEFPARIVGTDPPTDIAVLKVDMKRPLAAVTLADSSKLEVGDVVLAVGNPFAVGQTVTMGIISGLGRGGLGISGYEDFIQTDAAINPGNSGGALVDAQGRLVGINTAIVSRSGGNLGVGFAVPINMARFVMDRLIQDGKVTRGYLGVGIKTLTPDLARDFNLPEETGGVLVEEVAPGSAAARAGLKDGDVLTEFNGRKLTDDRNLRLMVAQTPPGTRVDLQLLRGQVGRRPKAHTVAATLDRQPDDLFTAHAETGEVKPKQRTPSNLDSLDGVEVTDLDSQTRRQLEIPESVQGALVTNVGQDSNSAEAGLQPGDVILEIDRHAVHDADAAVDLSDKAKGNQILLRVWRQGRRHYVPVDNTKHK